MSNKILGGKGDKLDYKKVDQSELKKGIKHEMEHTNSSIIAKEIALDHLAEDPKYYSRLEKAGIDEIKRMQKLAGIKLNELGISKPLFPFPPKKWTELGEDFKFEEDSHGEIQDDDNIIEVPDYLYFYYGIIFYNDSENKTLSTEIQYNDYGDDGEWDIIDKKIDELMEILDNNGYKHEVLAYSRKVDFTIFY